jgi:hypothetical protein
MSQRFSTLEERRCEMCTTMGFETPDPIAYPPLPHPAVEDPWAWYRSGKDDEDEESGEEEEDNNK